MSASAPALIQIITVFKDEDSLVSSKEKTSNWSLPYNSKCPILFNIMANVTIGRSMLVVLDYKE